jgi:hypothetical protein
VLPTHRREWKQWRAEIGRRIKATIGAEDALNMLVEAKCDREGLLFRLAAIAAWEGKRLHWSRTGRTRHLVKKAPKKLRDMAEMIREFEAVWPIRIKGQPEPEEICQALSAYAKELEQVIPDLLNPSRLTLEVMATCVLVGYVKFATGTNHDEKVSSLISAVKHTEFGTDLAYWRYKHRKEIEKWVDGVVNPVPVLVPRN